MHVLLFSYLRLSVIWKILVFESLDTLPKRYNWWVQFLAR
uniref:Uncharacterized protein n=1 Tax=Rhizophora mucronata TaxID=61149 RepID=A0A2P2P814_RHIMU